MTTVGELCGRDVIVATPETTISEAAKLMRHQHVGTLVVVDKMNGGLRKPVGIITDRDIAVGVTATDLDPRVITIGDVTLGKLVTVHAEESPLEAIRIMRAKGVRRLPVVNERGGLLGLIAFDDLLDVVAEQLSELTRIVGREQARETATRKA